MFVSTYEFPGSIAIVFFLFCAELGISQLRTGALLSAILAGDLVVTLFLTTRADRLGRRRTLVVGALLKTLAGACFAASSGFWPLVLAGVVGIISTSGGECGPFLPIEQAALTDSVLRGRGPSAPGSVAGDIAVLYSAYNALGYAFQALKAPPSLSCSRGPEPAPTRTNPRHASSSRRWARSLRGSPWKRCSARR